MPDPPGHFWDSSEDEREEISDRLPPIRENPVDRLRFRVEDAIRDGDDEATVRLVGEGSLILERFGDAAAQLLHVAAEEGRAAAVTALLTANPAVVDGPDETGSTPLMTAAWNGHLEAARLLLAAGADPNAIAHGGDPLGEPGTVELCPLHFALCRGHRPLIELLEPMTEPELQRCARETAGRWRAWDAARPPGPPPELDRLFLAISADDPDAVRAALADGADVNEGKFGSTPLWWAAAGGRDKVLPILLERGAEVDAPGNDRGETALAAATGRMKDRVLVPLLAAGADPDRPRDDGMTARTLSRRLGTHDRLDRAIAEARAIGSRGGDGQGPKAGSGST